MELTAQQIKDNWDKFISLIDEHISSPRKEKLLEFYNKHESRIALMPASTKKAHHSCFPGGYIYHVLKVVEFSIELHKTWTGKNDFETYKFEELMFSALNHDLGKIGTEEHEAYLPSDDKWRKEKLGEMYKHNDQFPFMSVPDRGLFLLNQIGVELSMNEFIGIKTHDGLYDEANKYYYIGGMPETKPRTALIYILHFADMMAARYEFEQEWLKPFINKSNLVNQKKVNTIKHKTNDSIKTKALGSIKSQGLKNMLDNI